MKVAKSFPSTLVTMLLLVGSFSLAFSSMKNALADEYDFSFSNLDHMRKAYHMCGMKHFQGGDCPTVYEKCWLPPHTIPHLFSASTSDCEDMWRMTNKSDDANKALKDGQQKTANGEKAGMSYTDGSHTAEASNMDDTTSESEPCAQSVDSTQCNAMVTVNETGTEESAATTATEAGQTAVATNVVTTDAPTAIVQAMDVATSSSTDASVTAPLLSGDPVQEPVLPVVLPPAT